MEGKVHVGMPIQFLYGGVHYLEYKTTLRRAKSHSFGVRLTHFEPISLLNQIKLESHSF